MKVNVESTGVLQDLYFTGRRSRREMYGGLISVAVNLRSCGDLQYSRSLWGTIEKIQGTTVEHASVIEDLLVRTTLHRCDADEPYSRDPICRGPDIQSRAIPTHRAVVSFPRATPENSSRFHSLPARHSGAGVCIAQPCKSG